jgi:hypothetical protein
MELISDVVGQGEMYLHHWEVGMYHCSQVRRSQPFTATYTLRLNNWCLAAVPRRTLQLGAQVARALRLAVMAPARGRRRDQNAQRAARRMGSGV